MNLPAVKPLLSAVPLLAFASGARPAAPVRPRPDPTLTVYAAASLTAAFGALGDTLERRMPGLHVVFNFAGSQQLALQIELGAAADVFASADQHWMADVRTHGLIADTPRVFVHNRLVAITPRGSPVRDLADLARPGVKVILAAAAVPVGRYARLAIANLARLPAYGAGFGARVLANVVSNEENVKAVVAKVQLGEADAGVVYVSDVTPSVAPAVREIAIPDRANVIADYPVAVVRRAPNPGAAAAFVRLLLSPAGQRVLAAHGFIPVAAH